MTVLFPDIDDPLLAPYVVPMGRVMLAYGRAMIAVREIAIAKHSDEAEADAFMFNVRSNNLVEKITGLCAPTLAPDRLAELREHCERLVELYRRRNRIVHGEWWFDHLDDGGLRVRDWDYKKRVAGHDVTVTPESLDQLARDFTEVSYDLDMFTYTPNIAD